MKHSSKENAQYLSQVATHKGLTNVVFSPGSRNAPLIIELGNHPNMHCITVPDERSAAFIALGQALASGQPTILVCTSGSALLNYYPAVAEAYYQKVPLIIASADRPTEWVDQLDGQTIRQHDVFKNHILKSVTLFKDGQDAQTQMHNQRAINEAINTAIEHRGPVHINFPFEEPLYETTEKTAPCKIISTFNGDAKLSEESLETLSESWNEAAKKLIVIGQIDHRGDLEDILEFLDADTSVAIFTETIANITSENSFDSIDRLMGLNEKAMETLAPDILLTIGNAVVSKKLKAFLRKFRPAQHWHISKNTEHPDTYQALTHSIHLNPDYFFTGILPLLEIKDSSYRSVWEGIAERRKKVHDNFVKSAPFSDLTVYRKITENLPSDINVHWANSTSIRYAQLFDYEYPVYHYCNRGTSGIEGSTSTALGFALESNEPTLLVTGDISFFYDSNAFFNNHVPQNLKVIVVNNNGGGIFRFIPGPDSTQHLETVFESKHTSEISGIAKAHNIPHRKVKTANELNNILPQFLNAFKGAEILEICTPDEESAETLKQYFKALKNG